MIEHAIQVVDQQVAGDLLRLAHSACSCGWVGPVRDSADPHQADLLDDDIVWHLHEAGMQCPHRGCLNCRFEFDVDADAELEEWLAIRGSGSPSAAICRNSPDARSRGRLTADSLALQLGYALLLGKPMIFVIPPGRGLPDGLVRAADALIQWTDDQTELHRRIGDAIDTLLPAAGGKEAQ